MQNPQPSFTRKISCTSRQKIMFLRSHEVHGMYEIFVLISRTYIYIRLLDSRSHRLYLRTTFWRYVSIASIPGLLAVNRNPRKSSPAATRNGRMQ